MAAVSDELEDTQKIYTNALLRFSKDQAPRLDRIRSRIQRIGDRMAKQMAAPPGENNHD